MAHVPELPKDMIHEIASKMSPKTLRQFAQTSRRNAEIAYQYTKKHYLLFFNTFDVGLDPVEYGGLKLHYAVLAVSREEAVQKWLLDRDKVFETFWDVRRLIGKPVDWDVKRVIGKPVPRDLQNICDAMERIVTDQGYLHDEGLHLFLRKYYKLLTDFLFQLPSYEFRVKAIQFHH